MTRVPSYPEEQQRLDKYKEKCANENDYCIIRILQEDIWDDTYDWMTEIQHSIERLHRQEKVMNVYLYK